MEELREKELRELKALISLLEDDDREVVTHIEQKLLSMDYRIIYFLEEQWMSNSLVPKVSKKIETVIHSLQYQLLKEKLIAWKKSGAEDILEGMMLVANYQHPDLNIEFLKRKFELYYRQSWGEFSQEFAPMNQVKALNNIFFSKIKFRPNTNNFHSPSNCMINTVMDSKRGNPLSLCVVYMLLAKKMKLPIYGVNLPSLFILTYKTEETQFYINVFNNGIIFTTEDVDNFLNQLHLKKKEEYYQPCSNVEMVARALRNLIDSFEKLGEHKKVDDIKMLLETVDNLKTN